MNEVLARIIETRRAHFPDSIETHCLVQNFFFNEELTPRRHDYNANVAGSLATSQLN